MNATGHLSISRPLHSWQPVNLADLTAAPPEPPTIAHVIYPGRVHVVSGEPETMKSLFAKAACIEQIRAGRTVVYIDFENGPRETAARLRALVATDTDLASFLYLQPTEPLTKPAISGVDALLEQREPSLIVIDSYTGSLALHGCDPNSSVDIERHARSVIDPLRAHGAAIVLLDHLVKNRDSRGRYSIGSERKIGAADVHIGFEAVTPLRRGGHGLVRLEVHKDRPGYLPRPRAGEIRFDSDPESGELTWTLRPVPDADETPTFRPTALMERVSRYLEGRLTPASRNDIETNVRGKAKYLRTAVDLLVTEQYASESDGPAGARLYQSIRPFQDVDVVPTSSHQQDPNLVPTSSQAKPLEQAENGTSSHLVPTSSRLPESTSSRSPLPPQGGDDRRDEVREPSARPLDEELSWR